MGGKKETVGLLKGKAAGVSRGGAEQEAARAVLGSSPLQQGGHTDTPLQSWTVYQSPVQSSAASQTVPPRARTFS
jgi:hypothetical protein